MKFKSGDECVCIVEGWDDKGTILQGPPHPVKDGIYTVNKSHSGYVSLIEVGTNTGYEDSGFEKLLRKSAFDKMIKGILNVPKKKTANLLS